MTSPTERSLAYLREQGYTVDKVEQRLPRTVITRDLFGFADLLAIKMGEILAVQVTSASNVAARRKKIAEEPRATLWKAAGGKIQLHGWAKRGPRGQRKTWTVKVEEV